MSKIIKLSSSNVKRIAAVEITPTGNVVIIGGKNGSGKTSCLDSIEWALGGPPSAKMPVRRGEDKAHIVVDLGDLIVKRTFTAAGGSSLVVTNADGAKQLSPQTILDKMVGKLTFDPLAFSRQKPTEQAETLRKLVGLDFTEHDKQHQKLYDERTAVNRDAKALQNRLAAMPKHEGAPEAEISAAEVLAEQEKAAQHNQAIETKGLNFRNLKFVVARETDACTAAENEIVRINADIRRLTESLVAVKAKLEAQKTTLAESTDKAQAAGVELAQLKGIDLAPFREKVSRVEADNRKVRENAVRAEVAAKFKAKDKEADDLTKKLEAMDSERKKKTTAAKYPIEGLMFDTAGGVTIGGIPFDQASTAEQLKVSVAIGIALNPTLKVLLIRHGNDLDEDSLKLIVAMAAEHDVQIWIEIVNPDDPTAVIIEDGRVKGAEQPELAKVEKGKA